MDPDDKKRKRAELVSDEIRALQEEHEKELKQKDDAIRAAMKLLCNPGNVPKRWRCMPDSIKNNPTAIAEAIAGDLFRTEDTSKVSDKVLQEAVSMLLENDRAAAVKACEKGVLPWSKVKPTAEEWRGYAYLSMKALTLGKVNDASQVPIVTHRMINDAVKNGYLWWEYVPTSFKDDLDLCRMILDPWDASFRIEEDRLKDRFRPIGGTNYDEASRAAVDILDRHSSLRGDHQVWEKLISSNKNYAQTIIRGVFQAGGGYLQPGGDHLKEACTKDFSLLLEIDQVTHHHLVRDFIEKNANTVFWTTEEFIVAFPEFVASQLDRVDPQQPYFSNLEDFAGIITDCSMWTDDLSERWLQRGLPIARTHPEDWRSDRQKFLMVARYGINREIKDGSFRHADGDLLVDAEFITQLMEIDPWLFLYASDELRNENYELAVWAMGNKYFLKRCYESISRVARRKRQGTQRHLAPILTEEKLKEYYTRAMKELAEHDNFVRGFLCAVCVHDDQRIMCEMNHTPLLRNIRDFAGIATGSHLRNIRKAVAVFKENQAKSSQRAYLSHTSELGTILVVLHA